MQYFFYGLIAFAGIVFFRVFLKTMKRTRPREFQQERYSSMTSFLDISVPLPGGCIQPHSSYPVLTKERVLTSLNICTGQKIEISRPKNIWHFKESQQPVPSVSLIFAADDMELSMTVDAEPYCLLWARAIRQAVLLSDTTVSVKCPIRLSIQAMDDQDCFSETVGFCKLRSVNETLEIEVAMIALRLPLGLDASARAAIDKALDFCHSFHDNPD